MKATQKTKQTTKWLYPLIERSHNTHLFSSMDNAKAWIENYAENKGKYCAYRKDPDYVKVYFSDRQTPTVKECAAAIFHDGRRDKYPYVLFLYATTTTTYELRKSGNAVDHLLWSCINDHEPSEALRAPFEDTRDGESYVIATDRHIVAVVRENQCAQIYCPTRLNVWPVFSLGDKITEYTINPDDLLKVELPMEYETEPAEVSEPCYDCDGTGKVEYEFCGKHDTYYQDEDCPTCDGTGTIHKDTIYSTGRLVASTSSVVQVGRLDVMCPNMQKVIHAVHALHPKEIFIAEDRKKRLVDFSFRDKAINITVTCAKPDYEPETVVELPVKRVKGARKV